MMREELAKAKVLKLLLCVGLGGVIMVTDLIEVHRTRACLFDLLKSPFVLVSRNAWRSEIARTNLLVSGHFASVISRIFVFG